MTFLRGRFKSELYYLSTHIWNTSYLSFFSLSYNKSILNLLNELKEIKGVKQLVAFCLLLKVRKDSSKWWIYTLRVLFPFIIKLNERESWKVSTNLRSLVCKEVQACHQNAHAPKDIILWKDKSTYICMFKLKIPRNLILSAPL